MRVKAKFLILFLTITVISLFLVTSYIYLLKQQVSLLIAHEKKEQVDFFNKILELKGKPLQVFSQDYTIWDDMVNFVAAPDKQWAAENINTGLATFEANAAWVYRNDATLVYSASNLGDAAFEGSVLPAGAINELFTRSRFCHFFIQTAKGLMEVYGAAVHPTKDIERKTPPQGYFFVGRLWDKDYMSGLSQLSDGTIFLSSPKDPETAFVVPLNLKNGVVSYSKILNGWDGNPLARVSIWYMSDYLTDFGKLSKIFFMVFIVFMLVVMVASAAAIEQWVILPLESISHSLDKQDATFLSKLRGFRNEFGKVSGLIQAFFEQRLRLIKSENELKAERDRLDKYLDVVGVMVLVIAADKTVTLINKRGCEILGYERNEIIGREWFSNFIPARLRNEVGDCFHSLLKGATEQCEYFENPVLTKKGQERIIAWHNTLLMGNDGSISTLSAGADITEHKRSEEELARAYNELKTTQAQLIQAAKMASLGTFASGVAHEINNPLTGVLNNVQLLKMLLEQKKKESIKPDEFREILGIVEESALRCKKITSSLLDFSHAYKGEFAPLSLNIIVDKVLTLIEHELNLQNITVEKELRKDLPLIFGDKQLLQQIVLNILSNAHWAIKKKSERAGGRIAIATGYAPETNSVFISISDTGIGMPQDKLSKIFEPFFTTKEVGEGTGLGLYIVYNIVRQHGGEIKAESELNQGTRFRIDFPALPDK